MPTNDSLSIDCAPIEGGYSRLIVSGAAGSGSEGNIHGQQIRHAIRDLIGRENPPGIVVDCRKLEYRFGNYMGGALLGKGFPRQRMCVLAQGETLRCLRSLWGVSGLNALIPVFDDESEAVEYVSRDIE